MNHEEDILEIDDASLLQSYKHCALLENLQSVKIK